MKKFFEDSSQAKMLTPEISYRYALRHMRNMEELVYELREYFKDGSYRLVDSFYTKKSAQVAKEFAVMQYGEHFAVVAVTPTYMRCKTQLSSLYGMLVGGD